MKLKRLMDEFNYVKAAYQYYFGFMFTIATYLTVSYTSLEKTIALVILIYLVAHFLGKWHYENINSGFNRQNYMIGKYSPPWQTLFRVLWILSEDHPEARNELKEWLEDGP